MGSSAEDRSREVGQRLREGPGTRLLDAVLTGPPPRHATAAATRRSALPPPSARSQLPKRSTTTARLGRSSHLSSRSAGRGGRPLRYARSASRIASSVQRTSAPPGAAEALPLRPPRRRSRSGCAPLLPLATPRRGSARPWRRRGRSRSAASPAMDPSRSSRVAIRRAPRCEDATMRQCAQACRQAAEQCRQMAA